MQKIIPHLWYDKEAMQAAEFYTDIFPDSKITHSAVLKDTPSGDAATVSFNIMGYNLMAISAGPYFKFNPSISLMINFNPSKDKDAAKKIDEIWSKLIEGGQALMEIGEYPFSKRYGWVQDKYGLSWQLILTNPEGEERPQVVPSMLFVRDVAGKAEEATDFYISVFKNSKRGIVARYPAGMNPEKEGSLMFTDFMLEGQWFAAMDSANEGHKFKFNEAVSLLVKCKDQTEIDYFWEKLSADPKAEQCGWLKDKFGVSWQITPEALDEYMSKGTPEQIQRVTQAFLKMKKFVVAELQRAFEGK